MVHGTGPRSGPGLFGENLTTEGLDLRNMVIDDRWQVGDQVILETTFGRIRVPPSSTG